MCCLARAGVCSRGSRERLALADDGEGQSVSCGSLDREPGLPSHGRMLDGVARRVGRCLIKLAGVGRHEQAGLGGRGGLPFLLLVHEHPDRSAYMWASGVDTK